MKHPVPISHLQLPMAARQLKTEPLPAERFTFHVSRFTHHASRFTFHERGVALVITLVLLSVITFMAVTFLVVSRSQHGSVATETDQQVARFAADTARERAIAQLVTPILASANEFNYGLLVSTNYISPAGFISGLSSPTNVGYNYPNGSPISTFGDYLQNQANLLYDARAPVFIVTDAFVATSNDFRFYLDLNRNGQYDPSGLQPEIVRDSAGALGYYDLGGKFVSYSWPPPPNIVSNFFMGDPEWIGVLRRPEFAHSADNPFIYRYAYFVVPASQTLDLNSIHNQARNTKATFNSLEFLRNQGVGTFEINLAAFLYDLNTNLYAWGGQYSYDPIGGFPAAGNAFLDAGSLLAYRYGMNPNTKNFTLANVSLLYPTVGPNAFRKDFIDGYCSGPVMRGTWWPVTTDRDSPLVNVAPWAGADNPYHFYSTQDLFDKNKTALGIGSGTYSFTDRLIAAGTNTDSYNRYTFYRLESQLGTDSAPEPGGKMNVNYCNVDTNGYVAPNMATNFQAWQSTNFFMNAAIRLLADAGYTVAPKNNPNSTSNVLAANYNAAGILITNLQIPIGSNSLYTPSVHRLLQLAANMYDATTNRTFNVPGATNGFPTVFRPLFKDLGGGRVFIIGYDEPTSAEMTAQINAMINTPGNPTLLPIDLSDPTETRTVLLRSMVYGIPLVIGAKKGLPNFNEFAMYSQVQVTRKLQFRRPGTSTTAPVNEIDQMFVAGI